MRRLPGPSLVARCSIRLSTPPRRGGADEEPGARPRPAAPPRGRPRTWKESMPPKARICRRATSCPGCDSRPGIVDGATPRVARERSRDRQGAGASARAIRQASVRRPRSTSQELKGEATAPRSVADVDRPLVQVVPAREDQRAALHVAVAAEVLGGRVQDHVGAQLEGPLQRGGGEGVVDQRQRARRRGRARPRPREVGDLEQRVGRASPARPGACPGRSAALQVAQVRPWPRRSTSIPQRGGTRAPAIRKP